MGLFDSVYAKCPHCGQDVEHQTKAGDCQMDVYSVENAPDWLLQDVLNEPTYCRHCGGWHALCDPALPPDPKQRKLNVRAVRVRTPDDAEISIHSSQPFLRWWYTDVLPFTRNDITDESFRFTEPENTSLDGTQHVENNGG